MHPSRKLKFMVCCWLAAALSGCAAPTVDFEKIQRPQRAAELDAYNVFVGSWTWEAEALNAKEPNRKWTGTAHWQWTLDQRCLHGMMSSKSASAEFQAAGIWSWHPTRKRYIWNMFNNWGFPQEGTAIYDAAKKCWRMKYDSIGLDGTASYGCYCMRVVDANTLSWSMVEWADPLHSCKKIEMCGTYKRAK